MHRQINALIDRQAGWAKPLGEKAQHLLGDAFATRRPLKDLLNGTWLGHPVHPVITDVPVGAMTVAALLDATGHDGAADLAVATGLGVIEVFRRLHVLERAGRVRCSGGGKGEPLYWTAATPRPATTGLHPPG